MKVKLLTFSNTPNYGALLQTYALSEILYSFGYQVELLKVLLYKPSLKNTLRRYLYDRFMLHFQKYYLPCYTKIENVDPGAIYIVGSDQVWNPHFIPLCRLLFFLDFLPTGIKKISYAASFGEQEFRCSDEDKKQIKMLLRDFSAISVRESSAVELCQNEFGVTPEHVLDPTLLLNDYSNISGTLTMQNDLVSFKFIQSSDYYQVLSFVAKRLNLKITRLDHRYIKIGEKEYISKHVSVNTWVKTIAESSFFITDSFHGVALALIHGKQFIVLPSVISRMGRVISLLRLLGIENRYYESVDEVYKRLDWMELIDYGKVFEKLNREREYSLSFLRNSLSK